jgi:abequosyltransferase
MDNKPILSICIPTYNREKYVVDAINSILKQVDDNNFNEIEICISDNCSTDNTENAIKFIKPFNLPIQIVYNKNARNLGADNNFLKVVEMASGEYCCFLSSDDAFEDSAINKMLNKIKLNRQTDIFILNCSAYDIALKNRILGVSVLKKKYGEDYYFENSFDAVKNITSQLGYISALMFRRNKWLEVIGYSDFIGSAYVHIYMILMMIKSGSRVLFVADDLIKYRFGNDSFLDDLGIFRRHKLDVESYYTISAKVFGEYSDAHRAIINAFFDTNVNAKMIGGIKVKRDKKLTKDINDLLFAYYKNFPKFWMIVVPFMLVPTWVYELATKTFYKRQFQKQYLKSA